MSGHRFASQSIIGIYVFHKCDHQTFYKIYPFHYQPIIDIYGFLRRDHAERDYLVATLNAVIVGRKREKTHSVK